MTGFRAGRWATALAAVIGLVGLGIGKAHAIPLQDLFDGSTITVGDKLFDSWELERDDSSLFFGVDFTQIDVVGLPDDGVNGPGLQFIGNGALFVELGDFIDFAIGFIVSVQDPSLRIVDNSLEIVAFDVVDDGFITIDETVFDAGFAALGSKHVEVDGLFGTEILLDSIEFPEQAQIFVEKDIFLDAGFFGSAELITFEQRFSQAAATVVPEPSTLALFGVGLAGLGLLAHRRRRRIAPGARR